jgi:hypothetical protein
VTADWEQMETPHRWFSCLERDGKHGTYCDACTRKWLAKLADPTADDLDSYVDFTEQP